MLHVVQFQVWHWACDFFKVARLGWGTCYHLRAPAPFSCSKPLEELRGLLPASFRFAAPKLGMSKKPEQERKKKNERRCAQTCILWSRYTSTYHLCTGGRKQSLKLTNPQIWSLDFLQVAVRTHVDLVISLIDALPCDSLLTASNCDSRVSLLCRVIICILLCRQQVATGRPSYRGSNSSFHDPPVSKILRQWFALTKSFLLGGLDIRNDPRCSWSSLGWKLCFCSSSISSELWGHESEYLKNRFQEPCCCAKAHCAKVGSRMRKS